MLDFDTGELQRNSETDTIIVREIESSNKYKKAVVIQYDGKLLRVELNKGNYGNIELVESYANQIREEQVERHYTSDNNAKAMYTEILRIGRSRLLLENTEFKAKGGSDSYVRVVLAENSKHYSCLTHYDAKKGKWVAGEIGLDRSTLN